MEGLKLLPQEKSCGAEFLKPVCCTRGFKDKFGLLGFIIAVCAVDVIMRERVNTPEGADYLQVLEFSSPFSAGAVTLNPDTILERNCSATVTWTSINTPAHIHGHYWIKLSYKDEMGAYQEIELEAHNHPK